MGDSKEGRSEEEKGRMEAIVISRLCRLIGGALPPDIEFSHSLAPLTKQAEQDLLISLSRVLKEIRQWKVQLDRNLDFGTTTKTLYDEDCSLHMPHAFERKTTCLANVTFRMVTFVESRNSFVQHLARNIFVAISSLLSKFDSKWILLLRYLWISLEISMSSMVKSISPSSSLSVVLKDERLLSQYSLIQNMASGAEYPCFEILNFVNFFQTKSFRDSGQMMAGLFHILYSILKLLKHEDSDLEEMYTHLAISSLVKLPWNLLVETHFNNTCTSHLKSSKFDMLGDIPELKDMLLATILQFLCSLVESDFIEANSVSSGELTLSFQYTDVILKLLPSFFQHLVCSKRSLSLYLRHKLLILMIRLTSHSHCSGSYFFLLLKLLKQYFGDLLYKPISEYDANCIISFEESPFFSSFDDGHQLHNLCTRHLHRQIIFIFLKCCLKLDLFSDKTTPQSSSGEVFHVSSLKFCSHVGALEIFKFLGKCASLDKIVNSDIYTVSLCEFTQSFLQLYMEEDDMLFDMLLQLLDAPFIALQEQNGGKSLSIEEMKIDIVFTISRVFNPIQLFHMFLLLLHYDHLVLIDYLISKDTGTRFLQYLLRCLRIICRSWDTFLGFSVTEDLNQPCIKRRRIMKGSCKLNSENFDLPPNVVKEWKAAELNVRKINSDYENVKVCLMSLRRTVEDIDQNKSFPYNPQPLLKSLIKFEELCNEKTLGWRNI